MRKLAPAWLFAILMLLIVPSLYSGESILSLPGVGGSPPPIVSNLPSSPGPIPQNDGIRGGIPLPPDVGMVAVTIDDVGTIYSDTITIGETTINIRANIITIVFDNGTTIRITKDESERYICFEIESGNFLLPACETISAAKKALSLLESNPRVNNPLTAKDGISGIVSITIRPENDGSELILEFACSKDGTSFSLPAVNRELSLGILRAISKASCKWI